MSEATIEYKNSPNESTAYAVSEGQKTKVQLVATPAGDLELADNPNVDTGYLVINGEKHKCALVAEVAGELKLPTSATDDTGYVTAQDGRQHKVKLVANITGGGGEPVDKTKFGVTIDDILGDVDADGAYISPTGTAVLDFSGVKTGLGIRYRFYGNNQISEVHADDLITLNLRSFYYTFAENTTVTIASFNSLESVSTSSAFDHCFYNCSSITKVTLNRLKKISGSNAFYMFCNSDGGRIQIDEMFPALEEVSGQSALSSFVQNVKDRVFRFNNVKKITGASSAYSATFYGFNMDGQKWYFPSATELTNYVWNGSKSTTEIHFAAANQAAIEACEGYDMKWGATNAAIYFDL